jgi:hypothetical protein
VPVLPSSPGEILVTIKTAMRRLMVINPSSLICHNQ